MSEEPRRWLHGTKSNHLANKIIDDQYLYGNGDFGDGGYVTTDRDWAREHGHALVEAVLEPKNPFFGGEKEHHTSEEGLNKRLRDLGHDVWFPRDDVGPDINKHQFAVILDNSSAWFRRPGK